MSVSTNKLSRFFAEHATPSYQYDKYFDDLPLVTVAVSNLKVSTLVEISDGNTVVETDVDCSQYISNVSYNATIGDTIWKFLPSLRWFEGKVYLVDKTKVGKVFTIVYEDNTSLHVPFKDLALVEGAK